jgi:hypothetical protein
VQRLTASPRESLSKTAVQGLLTAPGVTVTAGCDLLAADLTVVADISDDLAGGEVSRNNEARIHGTCSLRLSRELSWGTDLVRPYTTLSRVTGYEDVTREVYDGPKPYPDVVLADGPVGYWRLGEASGTVAADSSGNGWDATWANPLTATDGLIVADDNGAAAVTFGEGQKLTPPLAALPSGNEVTVEVWTRDLSRGTNTVLVRASDGADVQLNIHLPYSNDTVYWDAGGDAGYDRVLKAATADELSGVHHWVFTKDAVAGVMRIYLDGSVWVEGTGKTRPIKAAVSGALMDNPATATYDEYALYHRALTAAEVKEHFDAGRGRIPTYRTETTREPVVDEARFNLGVYSLTTPERVYDEDPATFTCQGYDRLYLLDREVGDSYEVASGALVLDAVRQAITDAGLSGVRLDGTAQDKTLPRAMTWPLVPTEGGSEPTTWLRIVNDLLRGVGYRGIWADQDGLFRSEPYASPSTRPVEWTLDEDELTTIQGPGRTLTRDIWKTPNKWIFVQSNRPDGAAAPTEGDGIYTVTNQSDGPTSVDSRGLTWARRYEYEAADQAALVSLGDRRVERDKRVTATWSVSTSPLPIAGHADVATLVVNGTSRKVLAHEWRLPLDGSDQSWTWDEVS